MVYVIMQVGENVHEITSVMVTGEEVKIHMVNVYTLVRSKSEYWNVTRNDYPINSSFNPSKPDANNWYYPGFCNYGNLYTISLTEPVVYINSTLTASQDFKSLPRTINANEPVSQEISSGTQARGQSTGFTGYVVYPVTSTSKNIVIRSTSIIGFTPEESLEINSGSNYLKIKPMGRGNILYTDQVVILIVHKPIIKVNLNLNMTHFY